MTNYCLGIITTWGELFENSPRPVLWKFLNNTSNVFHIFGQPKLNYQSFLTLVESQPNNEDNAKQMIHDFHKYLNEHDPKLNTRRIFLTNDFRPSPNEEKIILFSPQDFTTCRWRSIKLFAKELKLVYFMIDHTIITM